jgi:hypothetical protein
MENEMRAELNVLKGRILALETFIVAITTGMPSAALGDIPSEFESHANAVQQELKQPGHSEALRQSFAKSVDAIRAHHHGSTR